MVQIDKLQFMPDKGVQLRSVLSSLLFNIYLENAILQKKSLKSEIKKGNIHLFADDLLLATEDRYHTKKLISVLEEL
jgi:hypothetical protein